MTSEYEYYQGENIDGYEEEEEYNQGGEQEETEEGELEGQEKDEKDEEPSSSKDSESQLTSTLTLRNYISITSLLPDPEEWLNAKKRYKRRRLRFILFIFILCLTLWSANIPIFIVKYRRILAAEETRKSMLKRLEVDQPLPKTCIVINCVTVCPEVSNVANWYTLYDLPYAALPEKKAYFSEAISPYSFGECYLAYWRGVPKKKKQFSNGKLIFHGSKIPNDNFECAQMKIKNGKEIPVGNPHFCLTLSLHYPYGENTTKLPVVAYIGGDYMLTHRPQLISPKMASELGIIYIIINYRLGVFGFSDFGIADSKTNNGVRDIKKALLWIQQNIHYFNGDSSRVTIYGENAGATIAVALLELRNSADLVIGGQKLKLFSQIWLSDGSVFIPKSPNNQNPFHELVLHDEVLDKYCDEWKSQNAQKQTFSHPLRLKFYCLAEVPVDVWLRKTPIEWLQSRLADQDVLPYPDEKRFSIIKNDDDIIVNPIGSLIKTQTDSVASIRDVPLVIYSSVGHECTKSCMTNQSGHWSFQQLHKTVISEMDRFQAENRHAPSGNVLWNLYQRYIEQTISDLEYSNKLSKFNYKVIYDEIRRDLRANCIYSVYAKYLLNSRQSKVSPVYRLLNRIPRIIYVDGSKNRCDIPFYLIDSEFSCGAGTHPLHEKVNEMEMKATIELFSEFVRNGKMKRAKKMDITDDTSVNIAYNIVDDLDLTSPAGREIAMFQICEAWFSGDSGELFAASYSRLN